MRTLYRATCTGVSASTIKIKIKISYIRKITLKANSIEGEIIECVRKVAS